MLSYEETKELFDKAREQAKEDAKRYWMLVDSRLGCLPKEPSKKISYVTKKHPLKLMNLWPEFSLLDWREISEQEYQMSNYKL